MRKWLCALIALALFAAAPMALALDVDMEDIQLQLSQAEIDYLNSLIEDGLPEFGFIVVEWPDEETPLTLTTHEICTTWKVNAVNMDGTVIDASNMGLSKEAKFGGYNKFEYTSDGKTVTGTWKQEDTEEVFVTLDDGGEMLFAFNYDHDLELVDGTTTYVFRRVDYPYDGR